MPNVFKREYLFFNEPCRGLTASFQKKPRLFEVLEQARNVDAFSIADDDQIILRHRLRAIDRSLLDESLRGKSLGSGKEFE